MQLSNTSLTIASLVLAACGTRDLRIPSSPEAPQPEFARVTQAQWNALAQRRVYFGHQSVGGNIVDGIQRALTAHPEIRLRVVEADSVEASDPPGIYQARIGRNGDPGSKLAAFDRIMSSGAASVGAVKFCYVDVDGGRNPDSLFAAYQQEVARLRARLPGMTLVHVTMPLTTVTEGRRDRLMAWLRGTPTSSDLNVIRNRYNALLRRAYVGTAPVFDLAALEATRADGSRAFFLRGRDTVYTLATENTDDGGHLNANAQRRIAEAFLAVLANL